MAETDARAGARAGDQPVGELARQLSEQTSTLVRKELELARIEIKEEVSNVGKAGGILGGTAVAGYMALVMISFAIAWGLDAVMPTGFAFLLVGLVYAVVAAVLYSKGRAELQKVRPVPEQTVETLKEDVQWARQQMK